MAVFYTAYSVNHIQLFLAINIVNRKTFTTVILPITVCTVVFAIVPVIIVVTCLAISTVTQVICTAIKFTMLAVNFVDLAV